MAVPFSKLAADRYTPGVQVETDLESGNSALPGNVKSILLIGMKLAAGTASDNKVYRATSEKNARDLWGQGSELAAMVAAVLDVNSGIPVWGISYPEGTTPTAGKGIITLATNATANGTLTVWIAGRRIQVGVAKSETPTTVGDRLKDEINNLHKDLPCTAANVAGVVTITAVTKALHTNSIRYRSEMTPSIGMTAVDTGAAFTGGLVEGNPTTALAATEGQRFHYVVSNTDDSTTNAIVETHAIDQSEPEVAKWMHAVSALAGTLSAATTEATARDALRYVLLWLENNDVPVWECAARCAAKMAAKINRNESLDWETVKGIPAPYDKANWPNEADIEAALGGGVSPLRPLDNGDVEIVRVVHTDATSPAYRDFAITEIGDFLDEDLILQFRRKYAGKPMKTLSPAGRPTTVTPAKAKALLHSRLRVFDNTLDYIQGIDGYIKAGQTKAEANASDNNRMDLAFPFTPAYRAHRITILKTYTTPPIL